MEVLIWARLLEHTIEGRDKDETIKSREKKGEHKGKSGNREENGLLSVKRVSSTEE